MWRKIQKAERGSIRKIEKAVLKDRQLKVVMYTMLLLLLLIVYTHHIQVQQKDRIMWRYATEDERKRQEDYMDFGYLLIYAWECVLAGCCCLFYCRYMRKYMLEYLKGRIYVKDGVCIGKKAVSYRGLKYHYYISVLTVENEKIKDIQTSQVIDRLVDYNTPVLLAVREPVPGEALKVYPAGPVPKERLTTIGDFL